MELVRWSFTHQGCPVFPEHFLLQWFCAQVCWILRCPDVMGLYVSVLDMDMQEFVSHRKVDCSVRVQHPFSHLECISVIILHPARSWLLPSQL